MPGKSSLVIYCWVFNCLASIVGNMCWITKSTLNKLQYYTVCHGLWPLKVHVRVQLCVQLLVFWQGPWIGPCSYSRHPKQVFKYHALFFWISTGEESSQPTKRANKIIKSIFWLWRPHSLTHRVVHTLLYSLSCDFCGSNDLSEKSFN